MRPRYYLALFLIFLPACASAPTASTPPASPYQIMATTLNTSLASSNANSAKYCQASGSLSSCQAALQASSQAVSTFDAGLSKLNLEGPAAVAQSQLLQADQQLQGVLGLEINSPSLTSLLTYTPQLLTAGVAVSLASRQLRTALGLPPPPSPATP